MAPGPSYVVIDASNVQWFPIQSMGRTLRWDALYRALARGRRIEASFVHGSKLQHESDPSWFTTAEEHGFTAPPIDVRFRDRELLPSPLCVANAHGRDRLMCSADPPPPRSEDGPDEGTWCGPAAAKPGALLLIAFAGA